MPKPVATFCLSRHHQPLINEGTKNNAGTIHSWWLAPRSSLRISQRCPAYIWSFSLLFWNYTLSKNPVKYTLTVQDLLSIRSTVGTGYHLLSELHPNWSPESSPLWLVVENITPTLISLQECSGNSILSTILGLKVFVFDHYCMVYKELDQAQRCIGEVCSDNRPLHPEALK